MQVKPQRNVPALEHDRTLSTRDMTSSWTRLIDAHAATSKEIDALSVAEASRYVEQRRQFEHQISNAVTAFSCR